MEGSYGSQLPSSDATDDLIGFIPPSEVGSLNVAIPFRTGAFASKEEILQSAGHVFVISLDCAHRWVGPRCLYKRDSVTTC